MQIQTSIVVHTTNDPPAALQDETCERLLSPTIEVYSELQTAFTFFNQKLFDDRLPNCLITLQRKDRRTYGYFAPDRFTNGIGRVADEISLNPKRLRDRPFINVMSTLVHEMVHLWQHHFGNPSRTGYHNMEWARAMRTVGLKASNTGEIGGRETGQQMTHYIIAGGPFEVAALELQVAPFALSWFDVEGALFFRGARSSPGRDHPAPVNGSGQRAKFNCPECGANAWGKASLKILCLDCDQPMSRC